MVNLEQNFSTLITVSQGSCRFNYHTLLCSAMIAILSYAILKLCHYED